MAIEVSQFDLERIHSALNSAYHQNVALDLLESYRRMSAQKASAGTTMFRQAVELVDGYLQPPEEEESDG